MDFKHGTLIVCKILAGLNQQNEISTSQKNAIIKEWQSAVKNNDAGTLRATVIELKESTDNKKWKTELNALLEEL